MNCSKKDRILLGLKTFLITFPVGLLLQVLIGYSKVNILRSFLIAFGFSVGVSFIDLFIKNKKSVSEVSENEKNINSSYLSLFMGIASIPAFPFVIASILGIFYAILGLKSSKKKIAIIGIVLSSIGLLFAVIVYGSILYTQLIRNHT